MLRIHDGASEVSEELPGDVVRGVTGDPDDDYLAGVAFRGRADIVVSGDQHLLDLGIIRDGLGHVLAHVLTPRDVPGGTGEDSIEASLAARGRVIG